MCGITGIAVFNEQLPRPTVSQIRDMCNSIIHRGPDEEGIHISDNVGMGMRRLSIIDLKGGSQPIFNEDRSIVTVFNGEIYNFRELRSNLQSRGHHFQTNTDTEVIVHAYEEYGSNFPKLLNGMFAISLYDSNRRKLILARDHIGIKPFYYSFNHNRLVWGSEIKSLLASGLIDRELDMDALTQFLTWEYIPGNGTLFTTVRKLEPAEMIEFDMDNPACNPKAYWDVPLTECNYSNSAEDWEEEVDHKIQECVKRQMISNVPLGAFLSGGVDSSLVVASMGEARTFSIGFDDPTYNELPWARRVANHLGVDHLDDIIKPDIASLFDHLIYFMDDPIGDFSIFPTFLVSKYARKYVTVALSGDGGDELFGGYETYLADINSRTYELIPGFLRERLIEPFVKQIKPRPAKKGLVNKVKRFIEGFEHPEDLSHARWRIFMAPQLKQDLFTHDLQKKLTTSNGAHIRNLLHRAGDCPPINKNLYVDLKSYLCDNCLVKVDRMSMAVSLEVRVPHLDKELVELAFRIPARFKVDRSNTKVLLKKVASRHIPTNCIYRPKEGFSIPIKHWLADQLLPLMTDLLNSKKIASDGLFQPHTIERLKNEHLTGRANHSHILWSLMIFQAWRRRWLDSPSCATLNELPVVTV